MGGNMGVPCEQKEVKPVCLPNTRAPKQPQGQHLLRKKLSVYSG